MDEQNSQEQKKPGLLDLLLARKTATDASAQPGGPDKASIDALMQVYKDAAQNQKPDEASMLIPPIYHPIDRLKYALFGKVPTQEVAPNTFVGSSGGKDIVLPNEQ